MKHSSAEMATFDQHPIALLKTQARVLRALILRDIRTRFFGNGLGYIVAIMWPLIHIAVLLLVFEYTGRVSPFGSDTIVFLSASVVPVMCFLYMSRFIMFSVQSNKPLLNYPIVKIMDIIIARSILEALTAVCIVFVVWTVLYSADYKTAPHDQYQAFLAFISVIYCGLGLGMLNGLIAAKIPGWALAFVLIWILVYVTSGIGFIPDALPQEIQDIIAWNPVLSSVEWIRESYFYGYQSPVLDKSYPFVFGTALIFISLAADRLFQRFLLR